MSRGENLDFSGLNSRETKQMGGLYFLISCSTALLCFFPATSFAADTFTQSQSISDEQGQTLVSKEGSFELGFFSPENSKNRYVGIWYKNIPILTVVWVLNRDHPLTNSTGVLKIDNKGNFVLFNGTNGPIWSSNFTKATIAAAAATESLVVQLLESGNLVLKDGKDGSSESFLWQSFDYPCDTLLPGMKLGWNLKTGMNWRLSSWKSVDDPSTGDLTYGIELNEYPETVMRKGSKENYRAGPWNGLRYSGAPELKTNLIFSFKFTWNNDEVSYMYQLLNDNSVISRLVLNQSTGNGGELQRYTWNTLSRNWQLFLSVPRDYCDSYGLCGAYSDCDMNESPVCQCLKGFKPKSPSDWNLMDWSGGCVHQASLNCRKGEGFVKFTGVKLPDTRYTWVDKNINLKDCEVECLKNCSCTAYANSDISGGGSGCAIWFGDLIDIRRFSNGGGGQDLYIRMAASELAHDSKKKKRVIMIVLTVVPGMLLLGWFGWYFYKKEKSEGKVERNEERSYRDESNIDNLELPSFDFATIVKATDNFSDTNKLGEGGFGPVYKGKSVEGQEIAVKRLSKSSIQGLDEFKNEVILISKLQHRNLVKLLGCCIQGEERMLIYEYMDNKSLDSFIFDEKRSKLMDWEMRLHIIMGIARGLLYLHQDSRLRIIHRDLKASNILLDSKMEPKISDFGLARIFARDQTEAETRRVVGTYGYMSPEYAIDGLFSVKSDVYSFGVIVLEIISGKKNRGFYHPEFQLNLLGHAWTLCNGGRAMELIDPSMGELGSATDEVVRCIHVGLLCVQQNTEDRPTMSSVVLMLSSGCSLPKPQQPGFFAQRYPVMAPDSSSSKQESYITGDMSITLLEGR
ncbi:PREDICTED: G-type lectin S-receptor-like serine/threonine-protein kinase At4g27290 isoform X2 [Nelumbo nucifera]|uniref:Receptor-like serine/threonine-protein kinase n=1 Tax=Nelumbo nucifera TaxID=4432 RepID=A0A1U7Z9J8_NELNU|nr:PREDICTED: G-type lectin S-receptor-like serine/threonine-protein kinase At4g27290 isoform X2 [Nelumbo nucifera]